MNGIFNVLKPAGMTSNAVLTKIKKHFNIKKVGHLGTLDPAGTGVLPVTTGKASRLFDLFLKKDKVYKAVFTFGKTTDTLDSEGKIINEDGVIPTYEQIKKTIPNLVGEVDQMPPKFSSKNINGKRAYKLAREGVEFTLKTKKVNVYDIKLLEQTTKNSFLFEIHCSSGTYIRSICRDMASILDTYAFMSAIVRIKSGQFKIENSITIEELLKIGSQKHLISVEEILKDFEKLELDEKYYNQLINGVKIKFDKKLESSEFLLYCKSEPFGIAHIKDGFLKLKTNLRENN
jgi:tRNA pseudouridine55 synthase